MCLLVFSCINSPRLAFIEYLDAVNLSRTESKTQLETQIQELKKKQEEELKKIKETTSQEINFVHSKNEELKESITTIEKRFSEHLQIFRSFAFRNDSSSNFYRKLIEQVPEEIEVHENSTDHMLVSFFVLFFFRSFFF